MRLYTNINKFEMSMLTKIIDEVLIDVGSYKYNGDKLFYMDSSILYDFEHALVTTRQTYSEYKMYIQRLGVYALIATIVVSDKDISIRADYNPHNKVLLTFNPKTKEYDYITLKQINLKRLMEKI